MLFLLEAVVCGIEGQLPNYHISPTFTYIVWIYAVAYLCKSAFLPSPSVFVLVWRSDADGGSIRTWFVGVQKTETSFYFLETKGKGFRRMTFDVWTGTGQLTSWCSLRLGFPCTICCITADRPVKEWHSISPFRRHCYTCHVTNIVNRTIQGLGSFLSYCTGGRSGWMNVVKFWFRKTNRLDECTLRIFDSVVVCKCQATGGRCTNRIWLYFVLVRGKCFSIIWREVS